MQSETNPAPFNIFSRPLIFLFTHAVAPLLAALSMGFYSWLLWESLTTEPRSILIGATVVPLVLSALSVVAGWIWRKRSIPLLVLLAGTLLGIVSLICFFMYCLDVWNDAPAWMFSFSYILLVVSGLMPMVFAGIWALCTIPLPIRKGVDIGISIGVMVGVPMIAQFVGIMLANGGFREGYMLVAFAVVMVVLAPLLVFLALLRLLMWGMVWLNGLPRRAFTAPAITLIVALVLPLAGLILNRFIPFPADFQSPWAYGLTVLTAALLLLPARGSPGCLQVVWVLRWMCLPFTLYFFLVFLPFLPFAVGAILAAATGFLILSPLLLFWRHIFLLQEMAGQWVVSRRVKMLSALSGVLIMPVIFAGMLAGDRQALHAVLDFSFAQDATQDAALPLSPRRIQRVITKAADFKNGREIPILSAIYTRVVFDGLLLPDARLQQLRAYFPVANGENEKVDVFAALFQRNRRFEGNNRPQRIRPSANAFLKDAMVSVSTYEKEQIVTLTLTLNAQEFGQQEYRAALTLPPATWVTGLRLKINDEWEAGALVERRAAEWVYNQVTSQQQDPAILTLTTPEQGLLRVFPVARNLPRMVEVTLLQPAGMNLPIQFGEKIIEIPGEGITHNMMGGGVTYRMHELLPDPDAPVYVVVDSSANGPAREQVLQVLESLRPACILSANVETRTTFAGDVTAYSAALLPNRLGLDAARAVRRVAHLVRKREVGGKVVLVGNAWAEYVENMSAWDAVGLRSVTLYEQDAAGAGFSAREVLVQHPLGISFWPEGLDLELPEESGMPEDLQWSKGARTWALQLAFDDNRQQPDARRELLRRSVTTGVLTPLGSYIVLENETQRKMLRVKQWEAMHAHDAFDFDEVIESDAPAAWMLLLGLALICAARWLGARVCRMP